MPEQLVESVIGFTLDVEPIRDLVLGVLAGVSDRDAALSRLVGQRLPRIVEAVVAERWGWEEDRPSAGLAASLSHLWQEREQLTPLSDRVIDDLPPGHDREARKAREDVHLGQLIQLRSIANH